MASRCSSLLFFVLLCMLVPASAFAQRGDVTDSVRFEDDLNPNEFMITGRVRAVTVPDFVLRLFFDEHSSHWSEGQRNLSYGGEFVWRRGDDFELGIGIDYAELSMPEGFFLETGDEPRSADWTSIDMQVLSVVFSAYWFWDLQPWLSPYIGGGIGPGFIFGDVIRYQPDRQSPCYQNLGTGGTGIAFTPPECLRPDGQPSEDAIDFDNPEFEDRVPPVVPIVNLTLGLRFNMGDYAVLKLEGGFYTYFFAGAALGVQF